MGNAALIVLSGFWLFSAIEKCLVFDKAVASYGELKFPRPKALLVAVIGFEFVLGIGLIFMPTVFAVLSLLLLIVYQVFDYKLFKSRTDVNCFCFGAASRPASTSGFVINGAAMAFCIMSLGAASVLNAVHPIFFLLAVAGVVITLDQTARLVAAKREIAN